jgi:hypothetical protein
MSVGAELQIHRDWTWRPERPAPYLPALLLPPRPQAAERLMRREGSRLSEETPRVPVPKAATRALARVRSEAGLQRIGPARDLRPVIALTTILGRVGRWDHATRFPL